MLERDRKQVSQKYHEAVKLLAIQPPQFDKLFLALFDLGWYLQNIYPGESAQTIKDKLKSLTPPLNKSLSLDDSAIRNLELLFDSSAFLTGVENALFKLGLFGVVSIYGTTEYKSLSGKIDIPKNEIAYVENKLIEAQKQIELYKDIEIETLDDACKKLLEEIEKDIQEELKQSDPILHYQLFIKEESMYVSSTEKNRKVKLGINHLLVIENNMHCIDDIKNLSPGSTDLDQAHSLKKAMNNNERLKTAIHQYQSVKSVASTLSTTNHTPSHKIIHFKNEFKKQKPIINKRNDSATETFLKIVKTVLFTVSIWKISDIPSLWKSKGDKFSDQIKPAVKPKFKR